jgi:exosortase/archaeosortase family protein
MILFPGSWKKKLWYIPLGILVLHIVNIFRIVILSVVVVNWPRNWDFIHESIMRPFFYVVIFAMWVLWVERIRGEKKDGG